MFLFSCRDGHANNRQVMLFLEVAVHSYFTVLMFGKHQKTYGKTFMVQFVCNKAASYSPTTLLRANSNTGALLFRTFSVIFGTAFLKNTYLVSIFTFVDSTQRYTEKKSLVSFNILFFNFSLWIRAVYPTSTVFSNNKSKLYFALRYQENILSEWDGLLLQKRMY